MALRPWNSLSLCSGVGGLDLGVRLAAPWVRCVGYVERDAFAASVLVARMEDQALDRAPVWDDLATFGGAVASPFVGRVDLLTAGFSCQPWSSAGKGKGTEDERWIWPEINRVIRDIRPWLVFLENVPPLVVRGGLALVLGDLALQGFDAVWGRYSAAEAGAPHRRERLFILAWRVSDPRSDALWQLAERGRGDVAGPPLADAEGKRRTQGRARPDTRGQASAERAGQPVAGADCSEPKAEDGARGPDAGRSGSRVADCPPRRGRIEEGHALANAEGQRLPEEGGHRERPSERAPGGGAALSPFPPGPNADWSDVPSELHPATAQPGVHRVVDGLAGAGLDRPAPTTSRADRLRACGNGVVPQCAALAFRDLLSRVTA